MKWISVKDRLPNYDQIVLAYCDGRITTAAGWILVKFKFTHWMPLPEPPTD